MAFLPDTIISCNLNVFFCYGQTLQDLKNEYLLLRKWMGTKMDSQFVGERHSSILENLDTKVFKQWTSGGTKNILTNTMALLAKYISWEVDCKRLSFWAFFLDLLLDISLRSPCRSTLHLSLQITKFLIRLGDGGFFFQKRWR